MIRASITLLTMLHVEPDLFEDMVIPSRPFTPRGYAGLYLEGWDLDPDVLLNNLVMETAELNLLYTNPEFMKFAIGAWSAKELPVWQHLYETLFYKYNPIWNKDGSKLHTGSVTSAPGVAETEQTTYNLSDSDLRTTTNSGTLTTVTDRDTSEDTDITEDTDDTTTVSVSAFDTTAFQNRDQTVVDRSVVTDKGVTGTEDVTETMTDARSVSESGTSGRTGTETLVKSKTGTDLQSISDTDIETGNIGVTSSQELVQRERELAKFSIYDYIIESFKTRFCILVY